MARSRGNSQLIVGASALALLLWFLSRRAHAPFNPGLEIDFGGSEWYPAPEGWMPSQDYFDPVYDPPASTDPSADYFDPVYDPPASTDPSADYFDPVYDAPINWEFSNVNTAAQNLAAFLTLIKKAEHSAFTSDPYNVFYGGARFSNYADHPVITKEMRGVPLTAKQCADAGFSPGCVSTAAGAYQINKPTWDEFRASGGWGPRLPDFSPASQDEAARRILSKIGALPFVERGELESAMFYASRRWASLPGSTSGQPQRSWAWVLDTFADAGGVINGLA